MKKPSSEGRQIPGAALPPGARRSRALTLKTLGSASLSDGSRPPDAAIVFGPGKPLALLAYLHCAPNRAASRDRLVELFWSDGTAEAGQHNLRQTLWHIRQRLGDDVLKAQRGTVTLFAEVSCDRDAFLAAAEGGDLERGVALYGGDFLKGGTGPGANGFEDWAGLERYRLRQLFRRAAEAVVRDLLLATRFYDAVQLARRVRDADAEAEAGWQLLLEALLVAGDRTVAATEADVLEWHLSVRGREPGSATREILRRARRRTAEHATGAPTGMPTPRLVGRDAQVGTVLRGWDAVMRGRGSHVDVISAAGFGKTRLLKEMQERLTGLGAPAIYVAASPAACDVPHLFASELAAALATLPGAAGISTAAAAALVALNPSLSSRFPVAGDPAIGDEAIRRRLFALLDLVHAVADEQPFVVLLDDLHWADGGSRQILQGLIERVDRFRALIVTAARPAPSAHAVTSTSDVLHLPPLDLMAVRTLVTDLGALPRAPWADDLPVQLRSIAAGSPLVLLDLLQAALDGGVLTLGSGGWDCQDPQTLPAALEALGVKRVQPMESHPRSVLVMPFSAPRVREAERMSSGLTQDLIATLSRIGALRVIAWPSARQLDGVTKDIATLSGELNARYVLQGTVRIAEHEVDITAQLTDVVNEIAVWGDSYRGTLEDLCGIEQRFSRGIAAALLVKVNPSEERAIQCRSILNAQAYECYLRAREAMRHGLSRDQLVRAISLLRAGLRVGGDNALLYSTLGTVYVEHGLLLLENEGTLRRAEACARKALALAPESAEAHYVTGLVQCRRTSIKDGARSLLRALSIDPHHTDALFWCAGWLGCLGKIEAARPLARRLVEADPLTPSNFAMPGWVEWLGGRGSAAMQWYRRWLNVEPRNPGALHAAAQALIGNEQLEEARALLEALEEVAPTSPLTAFDRPFLLALRGQATEALAAVTSGIAAMAANFEVACWNLADLYAMVGVADDALVWLERAVLKGFINYPMLAEYDPFLRRLRGEPRFTRLLDDVKREWESLEL